MNPPVLTAGQRIRFAFKGAWHRGTVRIVSANRRSIAIVPDETVRLSSIGFDRESGEQVILLLWQGHTYLDIASKHTFLVESLLGSN